MLESTSALAMAFTGIVCVLLLCLLESRRAASCNSDDDCWWGESAVKVSVGRPALSTIALMIINVVMANNVAMASARRGALLRVLVQLLRLGSGIIA